jgi:predicted metalloprotease with PDZ domain
MSPSILLILTLLAVAPRMAASEAPNAAGPTYSVTASRIPAPSDHAFVGVISLAVDATDIRHRIFTVHERVPVQTPGRVTLLYPEWEMASHAATASVANLAGLVVHAGAVRLEWQRDEVDVHAFHVDVPAGVETLDLDFQYLSPPSTRSGGLEVTPDIVNVKWHRMLLYPAGWYARNLSVAATLKLPDGMSIASSLTVQGKRDGVVAFEPTSLETLVDSPVYAGRHVRQIDLTPGAAAPVRLNLLADSPASLQIKPEQIAGLQSMVEQTRRLFRSQHYGRYDILVSLSDTFPSGGGLEHLQSGENNLSSTFFTDPTHQLQYMDLIAHEYVHSWNGRFRQPADLWTPTYNTPMRGSLLWVYEGLTEYWGRVLAARASLRSRQDTLDAFALDAAIASARVGRAWKSLQDSNNDPLYMAGHPIAWRDWQRREDYYPEGVLLWLAVDGLLREKSSGSKSLDDFARGFFGIEDGSRITRTYTFEDVCAALNRIVPYDWVAFLRDRLDTHVDTRLFDGLTRAGYRLAFSDTPTEAFRQAEADGGTVDLGYSIGLAIGNGGIVRSASWRGPAFLAGISVGDHIVSVNGTAYSDAVVRAAVKSAARVPLDFGIESEGKTRTIRVIYEGTLRYPRLERIEGTSEALLRSLQAL